MEILLSYLRTGYSVPYGQCWVFAGVTTTGSGGTSTGGPGPDKEEGGQPGYTFKSQAQLGYSAGAGGGGW